MAIYKETIIPEVNETHKEIIESIIFEGKEMDLGKASIQVHSIGRKVDPETKDPVLVDGEFEYKGVGEIIETTLLDEAGISIDGITTEQVFSWLSKWTDYKKGEVVEGLELPE